VGPVIRRRPWLRLLAIPNIGKEHAALAGIYALQCGYI
jgi:hypothetical protein